MFAHNFPPSVGGVQTIAYNVSKRLVERGHNVTVYTSLHPGTRSIEVLNGVKVKRFRRRILGVGRPWYITPSMSKILTSNEVSDADVVHAFGFITFQALLAMLIKKIRRIPFVLHPLYHIKTNNTYENILGRYILSSADIIIIQSMIEKNNLPKYIREQKIRLIPEGINSLIYQDLPNPVIFRRKIGLNSNEKIILYVGALSGHKRVFDFINYLPKILRTLDKAKFVIIGEGRWKKRIFSRVKELKLEKNIFLMSTLTGDSLKEAYAAANVFVLPSMNESFGLVLLEAAACGNPIVSTRVGAACDLIDHEINGLSCETESLEQLADAIIEVLTNKNFGKEAMRRRNHILKKYDWGNIVRKLEKVYMRLV